MNVTQILEAIARGTPTKIDVSSKSELSTCLHVTFLQRICVVRALQIVCQLIWLENVFSLDMELGVPKRGGKCFMMTLYFGNDGSFRTENCMIYNETIPQLQKNLCGFAIRVAVEAV